MRNWLNRIDWSVFSIMMFFFVLVFMVFDVTCNGQTYQYLEFPDFTGGLNQSRIGRIQPNQCLALDNFLIDNGEVRVRDGYGHISDEFNTSGVSFLGLYRRQGTAGKLFVQSGSKLFIVNRANEDTVWTDDEYSELFVTTGTVNKGDSASYYLYSANESTKFESYAFTSIDLDSTGQTSKTVDVSYAVNDTTLRLATALTENVTGWTYSVTVSIGEIVSGETFVDLFYMATSTGSLRYNDSTLLGTQTQTAYRFVPARALIPGNDYVRYYAAAMLTGTLANAYIAATSGTAYAKVSLRQAGLAGSLLASEIYYLTTPITSVQWEDYPDTLSILTLGGTFPFDTTGAKPIVSIVEMDIDPVTAFTVYCDTVWAHNMLGSNPYVVIVDDSLMSGKDSTFFASGDWFYTLGTAAVDDYSSRWSSIIGNYLDDSLRIYATGLAYAFDFTDTLRTDEPVTFFRRKVRSASTSGYAAATFWNDRWCTVSNSTPSQIDFSEDFEPQTSSGYLVQVNPEDGEQILWLKPMYGTLIIGKNSSIWKLTGVPGIDAFARLDRAIDGLSFVAPRSIIVHNNLMFGLGNDGFYVFDYNSMVRISQPINDLVRDSINWDRTDQIVGGYFDGNFWWSYPQRGSLVNNRTVCYNPSVQAWSTATMDFGAILVDRGINDTSNVYLGDSETGKVYQYGKDNDDDGTAISATIKTGWFNMGSDWIDKIVNRGAITNHRKAATSFSLTLTAARPEGVSSDITRTFTGALSNYRGLSRSFFQADQLRGTQYQLSIEATTADSLRIGSVGLEYQVESIGN